MNVINLLDTFFLIVFNIFLIIILRRTYKDIYLKKAMFIVDIVWVIYNILFLVKMNDYFLLNIILLLGTYIFLCISHRIIFTKKLYILILFIFSILLLFEVRVLYGKYFYNNGLVKVSSYSIPIRHIEYLFSWFPAYEFLISFKFFEIGLEKSFVDTGSLDIQRILLHQTIIEFILSGVVVTVLSDILKETLLPNSEAKKTSEKSTIKLNNILLFSVGIREIYTKHFYTLLNKCFGIEINIDNKSIQSQKITFDISISNSFDEIIFNIEKEETVKAKTNSKYRYHLLEKEFSSLENGKYKIKVSLENGKSLQKTFKISQK